MSTLEAHQRRGDRVRTFLSPDGQTARVLWPAMSLFASGGRCYYHAVVKLFLGPDLLLDSAEFHYTLKYWVTKKPGPVAQIISHWRTNVEIQPGTYLFDRIWERADKCKDIMERRLREGASL
jgi:hypothetical protein